MAQSERNTFEEFRTRYEAETACREELFWLRYPERVVSISAAVGNIILSAPAIHISAGNATIRLLTVMHRIHLPLTKWFWAMYLCVTDKRRISASLLKDRLNVCYESA